MGNGSPPAVDPSGGDPRSPDDGSLGDWSMGGWSRQGPYYPPHNYPHGGGPPPLLPNSQNGRPIPRIPEFKIKVDRSSFPTISNIAHFRSWFIKLRAEAIAQGIFAAINFSYTPSTDPEWQNFYRILSYMYSVLLEVVKYTEGKRIVLRYKDNCDGRRAMHDLIRHYTNSPYAAYLSRNLFDRIQAMEVSKWSKGTVDFVLTFQERVEEFNEQQMSTGTRLSDEQAMMTLQRAVMSNEHLHAVQAQLLHFATMYPGHSQIDYQAYTQLLISAATVYDQRQLSHTKSRSSNLHQIAENPTDDSPPTSMDDSTDSAVDRLIAMEVKRQLSAAQTRLSDDTWSQLSSDARKLWTSLTPTDRNAIIHNQAPTSRQANVAETLLDSEDSAEQPSSPDDTPDRSVHTAVTEHHPADPRRALSSSNNGTPASSTKAAASKATPSKPATRQGFNVRWANVHSRPTSSDNTSGGYRPSDTNWAESTTDYIERLMTADDKVFPKDSDERDASVSGLKATEHKTVTRARSAFTIEATTRDDYCVDEDRIEDYDTESEHESVYSSGDEFNYGRDFR